jgi:Cof subfamily protein (haloacid dehalogenase superfamily)
MVGRLYVWLRGMKLIALDLDGTVLRADQTIHPTLVSAFSRAREAGITLAIATGRAFQSTKRIVQPFAFPGPLICSNGSQVLNDRHETIGSEFLDPDVQEYLLRYAQKHNIHVSAYSEEGVSTLQDSEWLTKYKQLVRGLEIPIIGFDALMAKTLFKIVYICEEEELPVHRQKMSFLASDGRAQLTESGPEYLEILPWRANKGNGLAKLSKYLCLDSSEIAAIGDYRNDLEMLEWVGTAGAVENALPEVKRLAQYVVKSNELGGVAEFIDRCILLNSINSKES